MTDPTGDNDNPAPTDIGSLDNPQQRPISGRHQAATSATRIPVVFVAAIAALLLVAGLTAATVLAWTDNGDHKSAAVTTPGASRLSPAATASSLSSPSPTSPTTISGRRYKAAAKPCDIAAWSALENAVGPVVEGDTAQRSTRAGPSTIMSCGARMGSLGQRGVTTLLITVIDDSSAQPMYDGLRKALQTDTELTAVANVGQAAYSYVDAVTGPHVAAYDGNLNITVGWASLGVPMTVSTDALIRALATVCQKTMDNLRA
jgi:hypothetical protein